MLEHLWNGWRSEYVQRDSKKESSSTSIFTKILDSGLSDEEAYIVHRGESCFVIMNAFPYSTGHMLVLPYREVGELDLLSPGEREEIWRLVERAVKALKAEYSPQGINVGINMGATAGGSVSQHLHVHVLPRWGGDSNFMVTVANTKILPEALDVSAGRLRSQFAKMEGAEHVG